MKKFKLTEETKISTSGVTLFRIEALIDFSISVSKGDKGGWVEKEGNLNQYGNAWVYGDAEVFGNAKIYGDASISGDAKIFGNAKVYENASISGNTKVYGNADVSGNTWIYGNVKVYDNARISGDARVSGDTCVCGKARVYGNADIAGDAKITVPVLNFINFAKCNLTAYCDYIQIGGKLHTKKEWAKIFKDKKYLELAKSENEYKKYELAYKFILSLDKLGE